ncbi:MAG TPA: iron ABC transporter permease [Thermoanaerobaculia bacterium]|nr:iron ABC transporter permease [Thermoanaerobaculia bacterium]
MSARRDLVRGIAVLSLILVLSILFAVSEGAVGVSFIEALRGDQRARMILFDLRLPRVLLAAAVGAVLASAGATFQTLLRNPLADPFILGVSGGAACGAAIATVIGAGRLPGGVPIAAFSGALGATLLVLAIARRHASVDPTRLILAGLVLNAFFSALILLALSMVRGSDLTVALHWMMGSLANPTWADVLLVGLAAVISLAICASMAGDIRLLVFGEEDAKSRGVSTEKVRVIAFLVASLATGAAVATSGIIGFVGLIVPHAVRMIWKRDYRLLLPLSAIGGAALVVLADLAARALIPPSELPLGALTAMLGVPFFLVLLRRATR